MKSCVVLAPRMKLVVAMDSFKGSLRAREAVDAVRRGIVSTRSDARVIARPMADGGEGTGEVIRAALGGTRIAVETTGPLPDMRMQAGFVWVPQWGPGALVEIASASGIEGLRRDQLDPMRTTSRGTGELVRAAVEMGARRVCLALGGSATVDGGVGMARALGWRFLDSEGLEVGEGGSGLLQLDRIEAPPEGPAPGVEFEVLYDVDNPLLGPGGAARVFGPQKGATPEQVERLEAGLARLARVIAREGGLEVSTVRGGGAAGGAGAGAVAFLGARLRSGVEAVMEVIDLDAALADADHVVTGEGCFDAQSLEGKVVSGVVAKARAHGVPVTVIAGRVELDAEWYRAAGIAHALALSPPGSESDEQFAGAAERLESVARAWASELAG